MLNWPFGVTLLPGKEAGGQLRIAATQQLPRRTSFVISVGQRDTHQVLISCVWCMLLPLSRCLQLVGKGHRSLRSFKPQITRVARNLTVWSQHFSKMVHAKGY